MEPREESRIDCERENLSLRAPPTSTPYTSFLSYACTIHRRFLFPSLPHSTLVVLALALPAFADIRCFLLFHPLSLSLSLPISSFCCFLLLSRALVLLISISVSSVSLRPPPLAPSRSFAAEQRFRCRFFPFFVVCRVPRF